MLSGPSLNKLVLLILSFETSIFLLLSSQCNGMKKARKFVSVWMENRFAAQNFLSLVNRLPDISI